MNCDFGLFLGEIGEWEEIRDEPDDFWGRWYFVLREGEHGGGSFLLFGTQVCVEAIQVTVEDGVQRAANPQWHDDFRALHALTHADGHFETTEIDGKPAVVFITPLC